MALELFQIFIASEPTSGEALAYHPIVEVVCIQVLKVMTLFLRIKPIIDVFVVCLCILMNDLMNDATSSASLEHQQYIKVS